MGVEQEERSDRGTVGKGKKERKKTNRGEGKVSAKLGTGGNSFSSEDGWIIPYPVTWVLWARVSPR